MRFEDGKTGTLSLAGKLNGPVFQTLKDKVLFDEVYVHLELHVVTWLNGANLVPEYVCQNAA